MEKTYIYITHLIYVNYRFRPGYNIEDGRVIIELGLHDTNFSHSQHTDTFGRDGPLTIFIHEKFNDETLENDIALISLDRNVSFNDYVRPICLAKNWTGISKQNQGVLLNANYLYNKTVHIAGEVKYFSLIYTIFIWLHINYAYFIIKRLGKQY